MSGSGDPGGNGLRVMADADIYELHTERLSTTGAPEDGRRSDHDDLAPAAGILVWAAVGLCLWIILAVSILIL